jgi:hypothetical protein
MNSDVLLDEPRRSTSLVQGMSTENRIQARTKLILRGLDLAVEIKQTMKTLFLLYSTCGLPLSRDRLHDIVRMIQMQKAVEVEFRSKRY